MLPKRELYSSSSIKSGASSHLRELIDSVYKDNVRDDTSAEDSPQSEGSYDEPSNVSSFNRYETGQITWLHKLNHKYTSTIQKGLTAINTHIDSGKEIAPEYFDEIFYRCFELCQTNDHGVTKWRALQTLAKLMLRHPIPEDTILPIISMLLEKVYDQDSSTRRYALKGLAVITENDFIPATEIAIIITHLEKAFLSSNHVFGHPEDRWYNGTNLLGQAMINVLKRKLADHT